MNCKEKKRKAILCTKLRMAKEERDEQLLGGV